MTNDRNLYLLLEDPLSEGNEDPLSEDDEDPLTEDEEDPLSEDDEDPLSEDIEEDELEVESVSFLNIAIVGPTVLNAWVVKATPPCATIFKLTSTNNIIVSLSFVVIEVLTVVIVDWSASASSAKNEVSLTSANACILVVWL